MNSEMKAMIEKWGEVLSEGKEFKTEKIKRSTALMLQNEYNYLNEAGNYTQTGLRRNLDYAPGDGNVGSGDFWQIAIPMVRRTFPELIAHDIVGVQPMSGPVGLAFAIRFRAVGTYDGSTNTELGYNYMDTSYSGASTSAGNVTSAGEELGSDVQTEDDCCERGLGIGDGTMIPEVNMTVEKAQVDAKTRKLRSRWSLEVAQDLKAMHNLDLEEEMMDMLAYEITAEIDRELVTEVNAQADTNTTTWNYDAADGQWMAEKYRVLYNLIIRKANEIAVNTRRGAGNFVLASPYVCAALESLSAFVVQPVSGDINTAQTGIARVGSLEGRLAVYRDTFATSNYITVGYKGPSEYDAGIIYLPYIQLMVSRATFEDSFHPTIGLMSRYGIHSHMFGASNYYQKINCTDLPS
jgi:hypothetical protein